MRRTKVWRAASFGPRVASSGATQGGGGGGGGDGDSGGGGGGGAGGNQMRRARTGIQCVDKCVSDEYIYKRMNDYDRIKKSI